MKNALKAILLILLVSGLPVAGEWKAEVQTSGSKEPQTIRIKSTGSDIFLENILFGEVWLCSGQSNMEQPVRGHYAQIAPYAYDWDGADNIVPLMREAQVQCLDLIPNSGIAITLDIGEEKIIHPAKKKEVAVIKRDGIYVNSDLVKNPVAVRYAWRSWVRGTLFDTNLLPASSFRTDRWDDATRVKELK